ncbi:hypothetical protein ABZ783_37395, partial [Micromonospora sp. NPDC047738]
MSNYLRNSDDANREAVPPIRRRRIWLATGVVGLTGAVSLAGVAYATTGAVGPHRLADVKWSTAQQLTDDAAKGEENDSRDEKGRDGKERGQEGKEQGKRGEERDEHGRRVREVPCRDEKLVEAIDLANRDHGGTLKLAKDCVYELDFADKKSGTALPTIRQDITIKGNDATIKRDSEDAFRLFRVADGGELTLKDLTLKDGNAAEFKYGKAPSSGSGSQGPWSPQGPQGAPGGAPAQGGAPGGAPGAQGGAPGGAPGAQGGAPGGAPGAVQGAPGMPGAPGGQGAMDGSSWSDGKDGKKEEKKEEKKEGEADGGAILVERGGSAHLEKVELT